MKKLIVEVLAEPEALVEACTMQNRRDDPCHPCCPFPAAACPIGMEDHCYLVKKEDWEAILAKEKTDGQEV